MVLFFFYISKSFTNLECPKYVLKRELFHSFDERKSQGFGGKNVDVHCSHDILLAQFITFDWVQSMISLNVCLENNN